MLGAAVKPFTTAAAVMPSGDSAKRDVLEPDDAIVEADQQGEHQEHDKENLETEHVLSYAASNALHKALDVCVGTALPI
jgi:hypothetical protein